LVCYCRRFQKALTPVPGFIRLFVALIIALILEPIPAAAAA
jgi:hypothetical protein